MSDENNPAKPSYSMGGSVGGASMGGAGMSASAGFGTQPQTAPATSGPIKDVTMQSFMRDVIEASNDAPVIVDFWAPWCGPCKTLGPIIEKVVSEASATGHGVTLAKMDIEKYPDIAQQMGIQSIPAVVSFVNGRPADAFMGAKPESEIRAFVDKLMKDHPGKPSEGPDLAAALDEADKLLAENNHAEAAEVYAAILAHEPGNLDALAGMGQCYIAIGELDLARDMMAQVPEEHRNSGPLAAVTKTLELAAQADGLGDLNTLAATAEADPKNHQARFDYAIALNANGERQAATEQLVAIVKADRKWNDDGARTQLLEFFESWGNMDEATLAGRRALSSVLFS